MTIKSKVFAAMATLTLVGGVAAGHLDRERGNPVMRGHVASTPTRWSTPAPSTNTPQNVLDVLRQGEKVGQPIILFRASNADPAEDFTVTSQGQVSSFYAAGLRPPRCDLATDALQRRDRQCRQLRVPVVRIPR